jgi:hypothetical protein
MKRFIAIVGFAVAGAGGTAEFVVSERVTRFLPAAR